MIFGGRNKLNAKGPFLELLREFERPLVNGVELLVVGYSFRDPHINEIIARWLDENPQARLVVIDPTRQLDGLAPFDREYLNRLEDRANRLRHISPGATDGIPQTADAFADLASFADA